jgi:hypothetical protein
MTIRFTLVLPMFRTVAEAIDPRKIFLERFSSAAVNWGGGFDPHCLGRFLFIFSGLQNS